MIQMQKCKNFLTLLVFTATLAGCAPTPFSSVTLNEAHQKFLKICQEEFHYPVITKNFPNTLWIYLPTEESFFDFQASPEGPQKSDQPTEGQVLQFLDVNFENQNFQISYAADTVKQYKDDPGYASVYNEKLSEMQNRIQTAILRAFGEVPASAAAGEKVPDFFVVVIADIKREIEARSLFYFEDFKQGQADPPGISTDEYIKRFINEVNGHPGIVNDTGGGHQDYHDITWPEFLSRQLQHRIRFKYQMSDFKPGPETETELIKIVHEALSTYDFKDFAAVKLLNLATGKTTVLAPSELKIFGK